jgi:hypothetical protein
MLAGSPGAAALHAVAELADARGDAKAGAELRAHAGAGVRLRQAVAAGRVAASWQRRVGSFHPLAD